MSRRLHRWCPGLLFALLALAAQVVLGIATPAAGVRVTPDQQLAALLADPGAMCHGDVGSGKQAPHHHGMDCMLCPFCAAITTAVMLRSDDPALLVPPAGRIVIATGDSKIMSLMPEPRLSARPRGPPVLA